MIITIDGPAGSGKSTTARKVAESLGYNYVDSGAMYRAVTLAAHINNCISSQDIIDMMPSITIELEMSSLGQKTFLNGRDISDQIRQPSISANVSYISSIKEVREAMVQVQREIGSRGSIVMDGRDIGTVVFPNAELKIYMTASIEERTNRRLQQMKKQCIKDIPKLHEIAAQIEARDYYDSHRDIDPLKPAIDAVILDTTGMSIDNQCAFILNKAQNILNLQ